MKLELPVLFFILCLTFHRLFVYWALIFGEFLIVCVYQLQLWLQRKQQESEQSPVKKGHKNQLKIQIELKKFSEIKANTEDHN